MAKTPTPQAIRQDILKLLKNNGRRAFRPKEIAKRLNYHDNKTYKLFRQVLEELDDRRLVARVKGGLYTYKQVATRLEGVLSVTQQGFGFVQVEGFKDDLYVRSVNLGTALDGDRVEIGLAAPARGERRQEAEVLKVLVRHRKQAVGTFHRKGHLGLVLPDDQRLHRDIIVAERDFNGAKSGDKVVVTIDRYPDAHAAPEGRVLSILGDSRDAEVRVLALAMSLDVRSGFSPEVIQEAESIAEAIPQAEIARRLDLRHKRIFTIDPEDAKDFDDAIHIETLPDGNYEVGVHIADVGYYVRPGGAIDQEGLLRGTSVYLVDRVIPMLPEKLSNRVCSLRPHEDKLTYSCLMEVTPRGSVKRYEIRETIIHSHQRLTYEEAQAVITDAASDHPLAKDIHQAAQLARTLTNKRMRQGSIDFDLPEVRVVLDDKGHPVKIVHKERLAAHRLIEELMLLANKTVAAHVGKGRAAKPFVYRVHDQPNMIKMQLLSEYVRAFGYTLPIQEGKVAAADLNALLERVKDTPEAFVIEDAALRAMAKAVYSPHNIGHFGLGFDTYTHFTSPIRRYPDLMVHRLLKHYATGGQEAEIESLERDCQHCSDRERVAVEAERESVRLKQVEYIQQHIGDQFEGVVSGVSKFGVFVELTEVLVEGMIHVRDLEDDYYVFDEATFSLIGEYSGRRFRPGDAVTVQVIAALTETRKIDLLLVK